MKSLCKIFCNKIEIYEGDENCNNIFNMLITELQNDYDKIIDDILKYMLKIVMTELKNEFFSKLFKKNCDIDTNKLIVLLNNKIPDICVWLNKKYCDEIIFMLLTQILSQYIFELEERRNKKIENTMILSTKIKNDKQIIKSYFSKLGIETTEFNILDNISKLIVEKSK